MIPEELYNVVFSGKTILFLGAGASKESGGPVGTELADFIAQELEIDEDTSDLAVFSQIVLKEKIVTRKRLEECVRSRFEKLVPSQGYKEMSYLPWKQIYSVNYDDLVEQAYKESKSWYELKVINENNIYDDREMHQINLFKLNGSVTDVYNRNKPLLITYDDLLNQDNFRNEMLKRLTASLHDTVIFVGYSFSDNVLEDILKKIKMSSNYESIKRKYVVSPDEEKSNIAKYKAIYDCEYVNLKAGQFFHELRHKFELNYQAKLEAYGKSLSFFNGSSKVSFPASLKFTLNSYFDYYDENEEYINDAEFYYRCGNPTWGNIKNGLDVNRNITVTMDSRKEIINSMDVTELIYNNLNKNEFLIYKVEGPIAVGKTTLCMRWAYELYYKGVLSFFVKDTEFLKKNLILEIYRNLNKPFAIFVDNALNSISKIKNIISECTTCNIPVSLFIIIRENDWQLLQDRQLGKRLDKSKAIFAIQDELNRQQSTELAHKLLTNKTFLSTPEYSIEDLISDFIKKKNIVVSLMEGIEKTNFKRKIIMDFDKLTERSKKAYAMISLINRLCLPFRWEHLQRTLDKEYGMTWEEFVEYVIAIECKGNILQQGEGEQLFFTCRHSLIANVITEVAYKNDKQKEINLYKTIVNSILIQTNEEIFVGRMMQYIINHQRELQYTDNQIIELIDEALKILTSPYFVLHIKGQFLMNNLNDYNGAISCFNKCIRNKQNREYALHSLAMAHLYLSQEPDVTDSIFQLEINETIQLLEEGMNEFNSNNYFYQTYLQVILIQLQNEHSETLFKKAQEAYKRYKNNCEEEIEVENYYAQIENYYSAICE